MASDSYEQKRKVLDICGTEKRIVLLINALDALKKDRRVLLLHSDNPDDLKKAYDELDSKFQWVIRKENARLETLLKDL